MDQGDERTQQMIGEGLIFGPDKMPVLIWRLKDAPVEVESTLIEDGYYGDEEGYRQWRSTKTGDEFIVMIPEDYNFGDLGIAFDLGLNVTERMRMRDFSEEHNPDCEAFIGLHYGKNEAGLWRGYDAYIIPSLTGRKAAPRERREET
jgi:hypothetical protein